MTYLDKLREIGEARNVWDDLIKVVEAAASWSAANNAAHEVGAYKSEYDDKLLWQQSARRQEDWIAREKLEQALAALREKVGEK